MKIVNYALPQCIYTNVYTGIKKINIIYDHNNNENSVVLNRIMRSLCAIDLTHDFNETAQIKEKEIFKGTEEQCKQFIADYKPNGICISEYHDVKIWTEPEAFENYISELDSANKICDSWTPEWAKDHAIRLNCLHYYRVQKTKDDGLCQGQNFLVNTKDLEAYQEALKKALSEWQMKR